MNIALLPVKYLYHLILFLSLSALFYSCNDLADTPGEKEQRVRLKRMYISNSTLPNRSYNNYIDLFYDGSGRLVAVKHFNTESGGMPVQTQYTDIYYDQDGKVEREITDGTEARSARYVYDAQNRLEGIEIKYDNSGRSGYHYSYDQEGRVAQQQFYVLNETGDSTTVSNQNYTYDSKGNIVTSYQTYKSDIGPAIERNINYQYDDKPNPWYKIPYMVMKSTAYMNSPYNVTEYSSIERNLPATGNSSYSYTHHFNNKYSDGLLEERETDMQNFWKFVYETY